MDDLFHVLHQALLSFTNISFPKPSSTLTHTPNIDSNNNNILHNNICHCHYILHVDEYKSLFDSLDLIQLDMLNTYYIKNQLHETRQE